MAETEMLAGAALRRLRKREDMTQAAMAARLGISPSYLALLERNQRPVSARVLVQLVDEFAFDPLRLREDEAIGGVQGLARRLADERFADLDIDRDEAIEFLSAAPQAAAAFARLFDLAVQDQGHAPAPTTPLDAALREVERWQNHFSAIDERAENLADELRLSRADMSFALVERLRDRHQLSLRVLPQSVMPDYQRRLDLHARQVQLSELLDPAARQFQLALQLIELECRDEIDDVVKGARFEDEAARVLFDRHVTDYFAAALIMPYGRFLRACDATGYDLPVLQRRFNVGAEQLAQRLTSLQRMGQRGRPFFMAKVDRAGQFSIRIGGASGAGFLDGTFGCPLWTVFAAPERPDGWSFQAIEQDRAGPGAHRWMTFSTTLADPATPDGGRFAVVVGVEARYAEGLVLARGFEPDGSGYTPVGPGCRRCHRLECLQRSLPPVGATLRADRTARRLIPFGLEPQQPG